jgi:hypothetical protein
VQLSARDFRSEIAGGLAALIRQIVKSIRDPHKLAFTSAMRALVANWRYSAPCARSSEMERSERGTQSGIRQHPSEKDPDGYHDV